MNKTKIIVVEDNIVYCEYVCNMLSREGYRNMKAYHLSTAKKHLQQATDNDTSGPTRGTLSSSATPGAATAREMSSAS